MTSTQPLVDRLIDMRNDVCRQIEAIAEQDPGRAALIADYLNLTMAAWETLAGLTSVMVALQALDMLPTILEMSIEASQLAHAEGLDAHAVKDALNTARAVVVAADTLKDYKGPAH